jgi:hypothetical protein
VIINPVNALVPTSDPAYVISFLIFCNPHKQIFHISILAVFDSIADKEPLHHINKHLRIWLHHQATNPSEGSLHLETIQAQVRSHSLSPLLSNTWIL